MVNSFKIYLSSKSIREYLEIKFKSKTNIIKYIVLFEFT